MQEYPEDIKSPERMTEEEFEDFKRRWHEQKNRPVTVMQHDMRALHVFDRRTKEILGCAPECPLYENSDLVMTAATNYEIMVDGKWEDVISEVRMDRLPGDGSLFRTDNAKLLLAIFGGKEDQSAAEYVQYIESQRTNAICTCEWLAHPDDVHLPEGTPGRRLRRGEVSMDCPIHTKEGFLIGFIRWLRRQT